MSKSNKNTSADTDDVEVAASPKPSKDAMRAKIFSAQSMDRKTVVVPFYGADIELRQPSVGEIEKLFDKETGKMSFVNMLIDHAYVPGTSEKVFTFADHDQLKDLPFNEDMSKVAETISKLTNVNIKAAEKN